MKARLRRRQVLRRQFNDAFCDPNGNFSPAKTIAICAQIATLYYFGREFHYLADKPESLLIVLTFLVAPDILKKALSMKYAGERK